MNACFPVAFSLIFILSPFFLSCIVDVRWDRSKQGTSAWEGHNKRGRHQQDTCSVLFPIATRFLLKTFLIKWLKKRQQTQSRKMPKVLKTGRSLPRTPPAELFHRLTRRCSSGRTERSRWETMKGICAPLFCLKGHQTLMGIQPTDSTRRPSVI